MPWSSIDTGSMWNEQHLNVGPVQVDLDKLGRTQFMVQHQDGKFGHFAVEVRVPTATLRESRLEPHTIPAPPCEYLYHMSSV